MKVNGKIYNFTAVRNPPIPYGVGMDDSVNEFWVVPACGEGFTKVFVRSILPVGEDRTKEPWVEQKPWVEQEESDLFLLGDILSRFSLWEGDEIYLQKSDFLS